jgi:pilus assembly protein Flp/PilA
MGIQSVLNSRCLVGLARFAADDRGATAIEYGLMAALISLAIIGTVEALGSSINTVLFGQIVTDLANMSK